jgi:hypothetical protein
VRDVGFDQSKRTVSIGLAREGHRMASELAVDSAIPHLIPARGKLANVAETAAPWLVSHHETCLF